MYESPITVLFGPKEGLEARKKAMEHLTDHVKDMVTETLANEEKIITEHIELSCEKALCLEIDKGELRKALLYDRQQYEKGYADGKATVIHCKDCEHWSPQEKSLQGRCELYGMYPTDSWFCGNARKKEGDDADTETVS